MIYPESAPLFVYLMTGTLTGLLGNRILLMSRSKTSDSLFAVDFLVAVSSRSRWSRQALGCKPRRYENQPALFPPSRSLIVTVRIGLCSRSWKHHLGLAGTRWLVASCFRQLVCCNRGGEESRSVKLRQPCSSAPSKLQQNHERASDRIRGIEATRADVASG